MNVLASVVGAVDKYKFGFLSKEATAAEESEFLSRLNARLADVGTYEITLLKEQLAGLELAPIELHTQADLEESIRDLKAGREAAIKDQEDAKSERTMHWKNTRHVKPPRSLDLIAQDDAVDKKVNDAINKTNQIIKDTEDKQRKLKEKIAHDKTVAELKLQIWKAEYDYSTAAT